VVLVDPMTDNANFQSWGAPVDTLEQAVERTRGRKFRVRWSGSRSQTMFEGLCWLAIKRGDVILAVDEVQFFVKKTPGGIPKYFQECCLAGRHNDVSVYCTSQRPALTHNDFLSQVQQWYVFRMQSPGDVDAIKRIVPNAESTLRFSQLGEHLTFPTPTEHPCAAIVT